MNEALNVRISATKTLHSVSSSPLPFSSHVHLVSVKDSPTAFLFAHFVHECLKIQRNDKKNEDEEDSDDDESNKDEDTKNERNATKTTKTSSSRTSKRKRAAIVFVETMKPFETSISPHLRRKKAEFLYQKKEKFGIESIDCWSTPMAFNFNDDDDKEEEDEKEENVFTVNGARSSATSSLDGLYDLIAKKVSGTVGDDTIGRTMEECSRNGGASIFIDSLDVLAARTSEKAVVRFLVRLRAMENVALVTGCQAAEDVEDGFLDEDDRERGTMQLLIENLADVTLTTSKLPSEGGNKGELVKVVTRHRTVDSKYLDWDGSVVDGNRTLLDEENGGSRRPGGKFSHVTAGVSSGRNFDDDDDDELTFSLTTECVATISELGAKCERYSFSL
jgi:hypothetical protein